MDFKDNYLKIITSQHRDKPKYLATMETLLNPLDGLFEIATYFDDEFDLDETVGKQQDILGTIIGQDRNLTFDYDGSSILDTEAYRVIQKAKIIRNLWNGEVGDLYVKWLVLFGKPIKVKDNQNMTMEILLDVDESTEMQKLMKLAVYGLIVPKPMGVGIKFEFYYPDIFMPLKIKHRAEIMQIVEAKHCTWNLGAIKFVRRDGIYYRNKLTRRNGIQPDGGYRTKQNHHAEIDLLINGSQKNNGQIVNCRNGNYVRNASHRRNGIYTKMAMLANYCTVSHIKNGVEVTECV